MQCDPFFFTPIRVASDTIFFSLAASSTSKSRTHKICTTVPPCGAATPARSMVHCQFSQVSISLNHIHDLSSQSMLNVPIVPVCLFPYDVILCTNDYFQPLLPLYAFVVPRLINTWTPDRCLLRLPEAPSQSLLSLFSEHAERYTVARVRWVGWWDRSDSTRTLVSCSGESSPFLSESPMLSVSSCSCDYYPNRRCNLRCSDTPPDDPVFRLLGAASRLRPLTLR